MFLSELWVALTRTALHCNEVGNLIVLPHSRKWLSQPLTESYSKTYTDEVKSISVTSTDTCFVLKGLISVAQKIELLHQSVHLSELA